MKKIFKTLSVGALISVIAIASVAAESKNDKTSTITTTITTTAKPETETEKKRYPMVPKADNKPNCTSDHGKTKDSGKEKHHFDDHHKHHGKDGKKFDEHKHNPQVKPDFKNNPKHDCPKPPVPKVYEKPVQPEKQKSTEQDKKKKTTPVEIKLDPLTTILGLLLL